MRPNVVRTLAVILLKSISVTYIISRTVMTSLWLFHAMGTPVADQSSGELARTAGSRTNATNNSEHYTPTLKFHFALHHHFMHSCAETPGDAWLPMVEHHAFYSTCVRLPLLLPVLRISSAISSYLCTHMLS